MLLPNYGGKVMELGQGSGCQRSGYCHIDNWYCLEGNANIVPLSLNLVQEETNMPNCSVTMFFVECMKGSLIYIVHVMLIYHCFMFIMASIDYEYSKWIPNSIFLLVQT